MELSFDHILTPTLTKADLAELLYQQLGLNKREAKDFIDEFFELITQQVAQGQDVKITGFGNFQVRTKQARPGRNPRTGEQVIIPPRRAVTFHANAKLKHSLQSSEIKS